jgi:hypothetical protein
MLGAKELPEKRRLLKAAPTCIQANDKSGSQEKRKQKGDNSHTSAILMMEGLKVGKITTKWYCRSPCFAPLLHRRTKRTFTSVQVVQVDDEPVQR